MTFQLTDKQNEVQDMMNGPYTHIMLLGGSRSGKTFLLVRAIVYRALNAANSRHVVLRFRYNHCKTTIMMDTFPKVMRMCLPKVPYDLNQTDGYVRYPNGSEIWFGGLDDSHRVEKILGAEYATIYLNECSQISYNSRNVVLTRLAQQCTKMDGTPLRPRFYYDMNPGNKQHWTYRLFVEKRDPETRQPLYGADDYFWARMNPLDNAANLAPNYMQQLQALPGHMQRRFLHGEFADATANTLFNGDTIDKWRVIDGSRQVPMQRIVIGVDPSGAKDKADGRTVSNDTNDAVGIVVVGLGVDGNAYVLEDCTVLDGPSVWGKVVGSAFDRHDADVVVGEANYGGDMVRHVIQTARVGTPYKAVTATRGKVVRAEPFSPLYESGKIRHIGYYPEMEDEMSAFTTQGYVGDSSPNRADALFWALAELFRGVVAPRHDVARGTFPEFVELTSGMGY